jgi:hypothetical protein
MQHSERKRCFFSRDFGVLGEAIPISLAVKIFHYLDTSVSGIKCSEFVGYSNI